MLSRVADNLYWMSRYLERAEHTARLVDVNLDHVLDHKSEYTMQRWNRLCDSLCIPSLGEEVDDTYSVTKALAFDATNPSSIISCIISARDNAQQVREGISSEMWEQLNRLFLYIKRTSIEDMWLSERHEFLARVKEGFQLFQGLTDSSMLHDEGWHFIRVGRFIERAWATAALLDVHFLTAAQEKVEGTNDVSCDHLDYLEWVSLLRSCGAFEVYCQVYTAASIHSHRIAEFLLLNAESPRSIRFAAAMIHSALQALARARGARQTSRVERLAGRMRAALDYDQIEDVIGENIHTYLENIQKQCVHIHNAIYQTYIFYPIDAAVISEGAVQS
jgi:uncharacterized alpha-E superfamily protein